MPFISKHILCAQDHRTFEHRRKHNGRFLYGCALARFLNISVICLCVYVLDMFFNALNYIFEPHSICISFENPNLYLSTKDPGTASYYIHSLSKLIVTLLIYDKSVKILSDIKDIKAKPITITLITFCFSESILYHSVPRRLQPGLWGYDQYTMYGSRLPHPYHTLVPQCEAAELSGFKVSLMIGNNEVIGPVTNLNHRVKISCHSGKSNSIFLV